MNTFITPLKIIIFLVIILIIIFITWRFFSERKSIPCPAWLSLMVEMDNPFSKINRAVTIIQNADIQPGQKILDAGCGPGRVTIPVAKKIGSTGNIVAMDIQEDMLTKVKNKAQTENLTNITYLHAGLGDNKLEKNTFDRILLVTVLGEIPNQKAALKEIFDGLKPNGILSITEIILDPHYQRRDTVLKLAQEVGFKEKNRYEDWIAYTLNLEKTS